jgi:hypothetical protein
VAADLNVDSWYRIRMSQLELSGGFLDVIKGVFYQAYIASNGPAGMALMVQQVVESKCISLYFTPQSMPYAKAIISAYSGEAVSPPNRKGLRFLVGDPLMATDTVLVC